MSEQPIVGKIVFEPKSFPGKRGFEQITHLRQTTLSEANDF